MSGKMNEILKQLMDQMNIRFDNLDQNMKDLKQQMNHNQIENRSYFKDIESRLDEQQSTFQVVSDEMGQIKIDIAYQSEKTGRHDTEINNINKRTKS